MRDGTEHLMTVEYDTKRMTTCSVRVVEQYIAVGMERDGRVPFSEDLLTAKHGNTH